MTTSGWTTWIPLLVAVLGIGGTLAGAWLGYLNAFRMERARWRREDRLRREREVREDRTRFHKERAVVYGQYHAAASRFSEACNDDNRAAFDFAYAQVQMLGGGDVGRAARRLHYATLDLLEMRGALTLDPATLLPREIPRPATFDEAVGRMAVTRREFLAVARTELGGVPDGATDE